jgi:bacterioferritin (cytochrome b1)
MNTQAIIHILNRLLESEFMALEYYRIHGDAISESEIAEGVKAIIPAESSHALNLSARIRELGGVAGESAEAAARRGREMGEESKKKGTLGMLRLEMEQEQNAIKDYAITVADIEDDLETLEMLEEQLLDEMRHAKWLKQKILELERGKAEFLK